MTFVLKSAGGQVVAQSTEAIQTDNERDLFFTAGRLWFDPRPSDGGYVEEVADAVPVPSEVSMAQALIALSRAGISSADVDAVIAAMPDGQDKTESGIWWSKATVVHRAHPLVASIGSTLNLTDEQIDDLFVTAATL